MSHFDDNENRIVYGRQPLRLAKSDLTCKHCGAKCYWQEVVDKDGFPRAKLFEHGKPHRCDISNQFEDCSS